MPKIISFIKIQAKVIKPYLLFMLSLCGLITSITLKKLNFSNYIIWLITIEATIILISTLYRFYDHFKYGDYSLNIIGIVAIFFSIIYRYYTVSLILMILLTLYPIIENILIDYLKDKNTFNFKPKNKMCHLNIGKKIIDQPIIKLKKNDKITIMIGETVPADCTIIEGKSNFNESIIFQNQKISKSVGDIIYQGSINLTEVIVAKVNNSYSESYLLLKNKAIKQALISQPIISKTIENNAFIYSLIILIIAILDFMFTSNHSDFLKIMILSSPFILLLPAETAYLGAIKVLSKNNIIVKSSKSLERLVKANSLIFTKNGVLNSSYNIIDKILSFSDLTTDELLVIAASMQTNLNHKITSTLIEQIKHKKLKLLKIKNIEQIDKQHLKANYKNQIIQIGSSKIINQDSITIPSEYDPKIIDSSAIFIVIDNLLVGIIIFENEITDNTVSAIKYFKQKFNNIIVISGDHKLAVNKVADKLHLSEFYYNFSLKDKLNYLENEKRRPIVLISTNASNNPLYQRSNVSIELNKALPNLLDNPANIVLPNNDLRTLARAYKISLKNHRDLKQLVVAGLLINLLLIGIVFYGNFSLVTSALLAPINIAAIIAIILFKDYRLQKIKQ